MSPFAGSATTLNANAHNLSLELGNLYIFLLLLLSYPSIESFSEGEGSKFTTLSSNGWTPRFFKALPQ